MGGSIKSVLTGVLLAAVVSVAALGVAVPIASAQALAPSPWWGVSSGSRPTDLVPGQPGRIVVTAQNRGDLATSGEVTVADALPVGVQAVAIEGVAGETEDSGIRNRGPVSCTLATLTCTFSGSLQPYEQIEVEIAVSVGTDAVSGERNTVTVSGGAAASAVSASHALEVGGRERFGVEDYELIPENAGGSVDTQAGSHPFQLTTVLTLNSTTPDKKGHPRTVALAKEIAAELPAGFIADPTPLARCTDEQFSKEPPEQTGQDGVVNECPPQSAVGVATVTFNEPRSNGFNTVTTPIFNMTPLPGEPARFGFRPLGIVSAFLEASVRTGGDYGVTLTSTDLPEIAWILSMKLTFWGVPGDPSHDGERGWECLKGFGTCPTSTATSPPPFLVMPTSCQAPFQSTVHGESWGSAEHAAEQAEPLAYSLRGGLAAPLGGEGEALSLDGCDRLPFAPSLAVSPEVSSASTPTGLTVAVHVPQTVNPTPESLAVSPAKGIALALPAGVTLNPAGAGGLEACSESEIGFTGFGELDPAAAPGVRTALFTPALPQPLDPGVNFCPDASKIGTVKLQTPILPDPLEGAVYLAAENANPYGSLAAIYIIARDPVSGTIVKLAGNLSLNQATGQIAVTFESTPQLPFEAIEIGFFGGERALLATPARCGSYTTLGSFTPWSGGEPVGSRSSFQITAGADGGAGVGGGAGGSPSPCPGASLPFAPSLAAGTANVNAGAFSPLTVTISRADGQQALAGFELRLPPGLSGMLSTVPLCGEAQANAGTCPAASQIGETTVSAGVGSDPYTLEGGRVYLTGPYDGAPFGLAIATPVQAGPLDLEDAPENHPACDCLVIRAKIEIDPQTGQLTIATGNSNGPAGATSGIPTIIDGIPLQIRHLNITIDRPGFIFNPTNCNKTAITANVTGGEGATATPSTPFRPGYCKNLKFTPKLTVATQAKTSRAGGASLTVKLSYPATGSSGSRTAAQAGHPAAGSGSQTAGIGTNPSANIAALKVDLPKALPARLRTLRQACLARVFQANPAACPAASIVGHARVVTPILPGVGGGGGAGGGVLTGPAYLVGRGPSRFPGLALVLSGDGVRIDLTGATAIDARTDVTSLTFRTLPDIPLSSLELTLPEGPHSALAANTNLCKRNNKLAMPTALVGQNGAEIHGSTKVGVLGCPAAPKVRKASKQKHASKKRKR